MAAHTLSLYVKMEPNVLDREGKYLTLPHYDGHLLGHLSRQWLNVFVVIVGGPGFVFYLAPLSYATMQLYLTC